MGIEEQVMYKKIRQDQPIHYPAPFYYVNNYTQPYRNLTIG